MPSSVVLMADLAAMAVQEGEVAGALGLEQSVGSDAELGKVGFVGPDLRLRHAADKVGLHVFRFRVGRVIHVAADIEVIVVLLHDLGLVHEAAVFRHFALLGEDEVDLLNVLGAELVLVLALHVFAVGIDEEHLARAGRQACSCLPR